MNITRVKFKDIELLPKLKINKPFKQHFQGSAPTPFIGRFGYPQINIGILSPQFTGEMEGYDSPRTWAKNNSKINEIADNRYSLVNSHQSGNVRALNDRFVKLCQEVALARISPEVEINLKKPPQLSLPLEREVAPFGPGSEIKTVRITSNTKMNSSLEKVFFDTDLKAADAITNLYNKGLEEQALTKIISVGGVGLKLHRKLVPTRWSITAVDDTIGRKLIKEIKNFQIGEYQAHFGGGWGNYYLLLFFSEVWSYELFEIYLPKAINPWSKKGYCYSTDFENYNGRKEYAKETAGGYYAARLSLLEKVRQNNKQLACLALRFITSEYTLPLGVWVCREAARKSCQSPVVKFSSEELMLNYAKQFIQSKFGFDLSGILAQSQLLRQKTQQRKLTQFR